MNQPFESSYPPPATIVADFLASSRYPLMRSNAFLSMTAATKFVKSRTSPCFISCIVAMQRAFTSGHIDFGTYARLAAEHFCP